MPIDHTKLSVPLTGQISVVVMRIYIFCFWTKCYAYYIRVVEIPHQLHNCAVVVLLLLCFMLRTLSMCSVFIFQSWCLSFITKSNVCLDEDLCECENVWEIEDEFWNSRTKCFMENIQAPNEFQQSWLLQMSTRLENSYHLYA